MQTIFAINKRYFKSSQGENDPKTCRIIMEEKYFQEFKFPSTALQIEKTAETQL